MPADILYIHQDGQLTGSAISLRNLLAGINRERYRPLVLLASEGPARNLYEKLNIRVDVTPMRFYGTAPGAYWFELTYYLNWLALIPHPRLAGYLQEIKPALVHINDKAMLAAGIAAKKSGIPIVWHLRSSYNVSHSRLQAWVSRQVIRSTSASVIAISEDECDGFEGFPGLHVIYNSVDPASADEARDQRKHTRALFGIGEDEIVIGMVGHLSAVRGAWDFIEMAGLLKQQFLTDKFRFVIVAPIPGREARSLGWRERTGLVDATHPEDRAWRLARQAGIAGNLIITGYRSEPLPVIAAMDIYVACNHFGAMGRPPFEAMSVGTPVAAWAGHSGKSRVVVDGETALLAVRRDKPALVSAIARLVMDQELREKMGACGRAYARVHFDPRSNSRAVEQVYDNILSEYKGTKK